MRPARMPRPLMLLSGPVLLLSLGACEGGGDPVNQALREASAEHHAAATRTTEQMDHAAMGHGTDHATAGQTPGDAAFAASETSMHANMAQASGETVDQAYIAKMIAHHEGAVEMAQVALAHSTDPEIRRMAQAVIDAQTTEIAEMRAWRPANP